MDRNGLIQQCRVKKIFFLLYSQRHEQADLPMENYIWVHFEEQENVQSVFLRETEKNEMTE